MKNNLIENKVEQERAVLIGAIYKLQTEHLTFEYLEELAFLLRTAGAEPVKTFVQKFDKPNPKTFVGTGKLEEISIYVKENDIQLVVFDDALSPSQQRNIEKVLGIRVLDRNGLILDIFAKRAQTASAKKQVELAQYEYILPRLAGMWTHLERQKGGIGLRGPGEKEIETDRRIIRDIISKLKKELELIDRQMSTQRQNRGEFVRVALVGYTNVGKSTLMNSISRTDVLAENKLFATLDTTVRKVVIGHLPFLLSDTVGFIRKLPTQLVESFKSTLDEVREADILVHVVDISHPSFEEHLATVRQTLKEIGASDKKEILVFNKIDQYTYTEKEEDDLTPKTVANMSLNDWQTTWLAQEQHCIFISAYEKEDVLRLKQLIYKVVHKLHNQRYPYNMIPDIFDENSL